MKKILNVIRRPYHFFVILNNRGLANWISDKFMVKILYRDVFGRKLNLDSPKTFNEKMQWLKLYNRKDIYTSYVDKLAVKDIVAKKIGKEYIIPTLKVYDSINEISLSDLPNQFVLKCTHDSGTVVICSNKKELNFKESKDKLKKRMSENYFYRLREWPYKNVKPRIIAEEFINDDKEGQLKDYKFFCFNGRVKFLKIDFDRFSNHRANYYDLNMKLLPFGEVDFMPDRNHIEKKPQNFEKMLELAEVLSEGLPFIRVDFYNVDGKIYFGELTFFPASGLGKFTDEKWDVEIGNMLEL